MNLAEAFRNVAANLNRVADDPYLVSVGDAIDVISAAFRADRKLLVFGNGGSSADAQHLVAELVGRFAADRRPLCAVALTTNQAVLTAWSNDHQFEGVFDRQVEALGRSGDVALGISTSGSSANVVNGLRRARTIGMTTIALTGADGGQVGAHADVLLAVPIKGTPRIQEVHLVTYHLICAEIEKRLLAGTL